MTQGAENDLIDIRVYQESTPVLFSRSNEPFEDLNTNILIVDNKAILARDTALTVQTDLGNHIGQAGIVEHALATTAVAGFMSALDKAKLDLIQEQAQLNILSPTDAIELISRKATTLHSHNLATTTLNGFFAATDKVKLDGIQAGAQVNNITNGNAVTLTSGGNADTLHNHFFSAGSENFTELVHFNTNHTGIQGVAAFPGFVDSAFNPGPPLGPGVGVLLHTANFTSFSSLEVVAAGFQDIRDFGYWGGSEFFAITNIVITGTTSVLTFEIGGYGDMQMRTWQKGYGVL